MALWIKLNDKQTQIIDRNANEFKKMLTQLKTINKYAIESMNQIIKITNSTEFFINPSNRSTNKETQTESDSRIDWNLFLNNSVIKNIKLLKLICDVLGVQIKDNNDKVINQVRTLTECTEDTCGFLAAFNMSNNSLYKTVGGLPIPGERNRTELVRKVHNIRVFGSPRSKKLEVRVANDPFSLKYLGSEDETVTSTRASAFEELQNASNGTTILKFFRDFQQKGFVNKNFSSMRFWCSIKKWKDLTNDEWVLVLSSIVRSFMTADVVFQSKTVKLKELIAESSSNIIHNNADIYMTNSYYRVNISKDLAIVVDVKDHKITTVMNHDAEWSMSEWAMIKHMLKLLETNIKMTLSSEYALVMRPLSLEYSEDLNNAINGMIEMKKNLVSPKIENNEDEEGEAPW